MAMFNLTQIMTRDPKIEGCVYEFANILINDERITNNYVDCYFPKPECLCGCVL